MAAIPPTSTAVDACALTDAQQALLARLHAYSSDDPHAPLPYSRRLAEAEGWSHDHALAVIDEYKRFAFLAQVAGHPVTPSHAVDAAWHLHLQYTREYWDVFCADVLRAPMHHVPGAGAPDEAAQYARHYRQTLDSYRRLFGCEPPEAIWPRPVAEPAVPADAPVQRAELRDGPSSAPAARPPRARDAGGASRSSRGQRRRSASRRPARARAISMCWTSLGRTFSGCSTCRSASPRCC
ncbi:hypothetical protein [Burkholderia sp. BCC0397]|uniref:glycine-rich domain-containing protein n=1 Tax=Burkholderia sp. BCC0397 TaxID=486876 RepID=UPI001FC7CFEF|nr:hypothetical protein [Burkholderia sp. BCC0397]